MKSQVKPVAPKALLYIGLDVHKDTIAVAIADEGCSGEVRCFGSISGDLQALERLIAKIRKVHAVGCDQLRVVYEAGPCGFVIARRLAQLGIERLPRFPQSAATRLKPTTATP